MAAAETDTRGFDRVVVDFDLLVDDAEFQLRRIARWLDLPADPDRLCAFRDQFIDSELVHSDSDPLGALATDSVPLEAEAIYLRLADLARAEQPAHGPDAAAPSAHPTAFGLQHRVVAWAGALRGALHARTELLTASPGRAGRFLNRFVRPLARAARRLFGRRDFNDDVRRAIRPRTRTG
jgi:hypothetical protein